MPQISKEEMYGVQDELLIAIADDMTPLSVDLLNKLPPYRAYLIARVARRAGRPLEFGTVEQLEEEAMKLGGNGKLGQWWTRAAD
jgi:hypothetical protein